MGVAGQSVKGRTKVEVARMIQAIKVWYRKFLNFRIPIKFTENTQLLTKRFYHCVMQSNDANEIAVSEDPDQTGTAVRGAV